MKQFARSISLKSMNTAAEAIQTLHKFAKPQKTEILQRFFKTGPGQYAEGDVFIGASVPETRSIAKQFRELPLKEAEILLRSRIHEERQLALFILVHQSKKAKSADLRARICRFISSPIFVPRAVWVWLPRLA